MIVPLVEGYGDLSAVPELLRRLVAQAHGTVGVDRAWRLTRPTMLNEHELKRYAKAAALGPQCSALIAVFDADDDLACVVGPRVSAWLSEAVPNKPTAAVVAKREYEAWILASLESVRGCRAIQQGAIYLGDPETPRNPKGEIEAWMPRGRSYHETADQVALTAAMDLETTFRRCSSFQKMVRDLNRILQALGASAVELPPPEWLA